MKVNRNIISAVKRTKKKNVPVVSARKVSLSALHAAGDPLRAFGTNWLLNLVYTLRHTYLHHFCYPGLVPPIKRNRVVPIIVSLPCEESMMLQGNPHSTWL